MKYVLVTGGVVSGLGKGVTASSIGLILKACGLRVTSIKIGLFLFSLLTICFFHDFDIFKMELCVIMIMVDHVFGLCVLEWCLVL